MFAAAEIFSPLLFVVILQSAEKYSLGRFGEGVYNFAMRGRYVDTYKRVGSRELIAAYDKEENSGALSVCL